LRLSRPSYRRRDVAGCHLAYADECRTGGYSRITDTYNRPPRGGCFTSGALPSRRLPCARASCFCCSWMLDACCDFLFAKPVGVLKRELEHEPAHSPNVAGREGNAPGWLSVRDGLPVGYFHAAPICTPTHNPSGVFLGANVTLQLKLRACRRRP